MPHFTKKRFQWGQWGWVFGIVFFVTSFSFNSSLRAAALQSPEDLLFISIDGFSSEFFWQAMQKDREALPHFQSILDNGYVARQLIPPLPSLTATGHITLITGTMPSSHGVVSNSFHEPSDSFNRNTNGFDYPYTPAPLWKMARQRGKKVGIVTYPGIHAADGGSPADWGIYYSHSLSSAFIKEFKLENFEYQDSERRYAAHPFSIRWHRSRQEEEKSLYLIYDAVDHETYVDEDQDIDNGFLSRLSATSSWFPLSFKSQEETYGNWNYVLKKEPDTLRLYIGSLYETRAYPQLYQQAILDRLGVWPGQPSHSFTQMGLSPQIYVDQALRLSQYLASVTTLGMELNPWNLVVSYQPILDELEHQFYVVDPRQKDFESKKDVVRYVELGYRHIDKIVGELAQSTPNMLIVGDHGMAPLHTIVYLNRMLREWNYGTTVRAVTSGGCGHLYIAPQINGKAKQRLVADLVGRLKQISSPHNETLFEIVMTKEQSSQYDLQHDNTGDVVVITLPGYHLQDTNSRGPLFEPATFYGQHGYSPEHSSMSSLLLGYGSQFKKGEQERLRMDEVLPLAKEILGL